ncbi:hypothetical protein V8C40DRAFT_151181 [Trichoderma camerunense]
MTLLNLHISYSYFISACLSQINHVWLGKLLALACSLFLSLFYAYVYCSRLDTARGRGLRR